MTSPLKRLFSFLLLLATVTSAVPMVEDELRIDDTLETTEQQLEEETTEKLTSFQRMKKWVREHKAETVSMVAMLAFIGDIAQAKARGKRPLMQPVHQLMGDIFRRKGEEVTRAPLYELAQARGQGDGRIFWEKSH